MTCNDICIAFMHETSCRVGCECMVGSTLCLVFDHGKLVFWTTYNEVSWVHFNCLE